MHPQPGGTLAVDCAMVAPTTVERAGSRSAAASGAAESLECFDGFVITESLEEDTQDPVAATVSNELEEDTQPLMGHGSDESDMGPDVEISGQIRENDVDVEISSEIRENDFDEKWSDWSPHGRMASSKTSKKGEQVDEVQETQVFSGDPDEEVQEKQVSQVEDTDYTQNTEDISLPSTRSWLPEGEVASQPSIVTIRGPSPMSGEPGVYSDSEDTSDGDDSEEKPSTNPLYEFTVPLPISQEDVLNELVTHIMDNPESRSQSFPLWIQQVIPPRGASLTTEPVIRPMNCDLSAVFFLNRKKYRVRLAAESLAVTERLTTPWDFQLTDLGRRDRSRSRARTAGSSESE